MRRLLAVILSAIIGCGALAQSASHICGSGEYLWAQASDVRPSVANRQTVAGLVDKLSATDILQVDKAQRKALWETYDSELLNVSQTTISPDGFIIRYIAWRSINKVFEPRWRKVRELVQSAQRTADTDKARTYIFWAETYLKSLPKDNGGLRGEVAKMKVKLGSGRTDAVRMRNIESEVAAILKALEKHQKPAKEVASAPKKTTPTPQPAVIVPKKAPFGVRITALEGAPEFSPLPLPWTPGSSNLAPAMNSGRRHLYLRWSALLSADIGVAPAFGPTIIGCGKRLGFYAAAKSSFTTSDSDYECLSDGTTSFGTIWASGNIRKCRRSLSAGPVFRLTGSLYLYAGAGYANQCVFWEDSVSKWAEVTDLSHEGLLLEAGALYRINHFLFGLGVSETDSSVAALTLSAGWNF